MNLEKECLDFSVAVIGLAGRFPGAKNVKEFWNNLVSEKESISFFTDEELRESRIEQKFIDNPSYVRAKGVLGDSEYFDASFFGYSPREAEILDPQHRIFLESAWHAMEDAGYNPFKIAGKVGVFAGAGVPSYHLEIHKSSALANGISVIISNEKDYLATRVSYKLNLTGTSVSVQCACSTSLTAIVLGVQSLLTYQNDMVLAGGVSVSFPENQGYLYEKGSLDSPDGHCRTFDARAEGTVFSSGAGVVVLKRLSDAVRDGDNIYCIIRGGSTNNDGLSKASYTAPSVHGQVAVEVDALEMAGVNPETITYVEAHGTATQLGDPIEVKALTEAFRQYTLKNNYCALGSVKSNIGHTDVASGVIGLIKVALAMKYHIIPAHLHFETPNPQIDFVSSPFYVNVKTREWVASEEFPRRALLNSFGVGGSNACLILEEASPVLSSDNKERPYYLLPLSAKTETALAEASSSLLEHIEEHPKVNLTDLVYTLQSGRALFEHRKAVLFSSRKELVELLKNKDGLSVASADKDEDVIFMFPGQGNQYLKMGKELYESEPFFQKEIDNCCEILSNLHYEYDLKGELFLGEGTRVHQTIIAQPALFIIEFSLAQFLMHLGVIPKAMIGHSIGEFVAACIAGVISKKDALMIVIARAKMTQSLPEGSMLAIFEEYEKVKEWTVHPNEVAVINGPKLTVVSGTTEAIAALEEELLQKNVFCKRLNTSHAFHSHMMDPLIAPLQAMISQIKLSSLQIPIISTATGDWMSDEQAQDPAYWAEHARKPVLFSTAAQELLAQGNHFYIEVGPGHSLESAIKSCSTSADNKIVGVMDALQGASTSDKFFYLALAKIWALGGKIDLAQLHGGKKVSLPGYPFERNKFVLGFKEVAAVKLQESGKKQDIGEWFYLPSWKKSIPLNLAFDRSIPNENAVWIVFHNDDSLGRALITYLKQASQTVCSVQIGGNYTEHSPFDYCIDPANPQDYLRLIERIKETTRDRGYRILHLWNFNHREAIVLDRLGELENRNFYSLLFLEQALIRQNVMGNLHITFVGNNIYNITNDEIDIFQSLMVGPCRVFKNEYPHVYSRLLDIVDCQAQEKLIRLIIAENIYESDEIIVAYRNFSRWIPIYEPIYLAKNRTKSLAKEGGIYLFTGGLGAIGLTLAKSIAQSARVTIVLLQRSELPEKHEWDRWLEKEHKISNQIRAIKEIEALGSTVIVKKADVACYTEMESLVSEILSSYVKIDGVLHCAGIPGGGIISLKSREKVEEVLKSKVRGTLILEELLKNQTLDFFIVCSSVTGIIGDKGQVDYCSANAFLDAFANSRDRSIYSSINWGTWDEIGMAVESASNSTVLQDQPSQRPYSKRLSLLSSIEGERHYEVSLFPEKDWFIHTHRLRGVPTLVGTAFFEFLLEYVKDRQAFIKCEISHAQFVSPLMFFSDVDKKLSLKISNNGFTFFSSKNKQEYIYGEISLQEEVEDEFINVRQLIGRLREDFDLGKIEEDAPGMPLVRGARWKTVSKIYKGEKEWLAHLALSSIYRKEAQEFVLHPALLDFATSFSVSYIVESFYLPYMYEKICIFHPLEEEIYSYVRLKEQKEDQLSLDIDLLGKSGKVLVRIKGYTLKKVAINAATAAIKNAQEKVSQNILPKEGAEVFNRFFQQCTLPQIIICAEDFNDLVKENQPSKEHKETVVEKKVAKHTRPHLFTPYVAPSNEIEKAIIVIWESVLGINQLGIDDNFIELGGNSLSAIQIIAQLTEIFKMEFRVESFLANPTVRGASDFIISQLIEDLDEENMKEIMSVSGY